MPFVKVVKNKAYFKRFQVKFRRRRGTFNLNKIFLKYIFLTFPFLKIQRRGKD